MMHPALLILFIVGAVCSLDSSFAQDFWQPPVTNWPFPGDNTPSPFPFPGPISKRENGSPERVGALRNLIIRLLRDVQRGMDSGQVLQAVQEIRLSADDIIAANGSVVSHEEIMSAIREAGANFLDGDVEFSDIFGEHIKQDKKLLLISFRLLLNLVNKLTQQTANGEPTDVTLAAISFVSEAIQSVVDDTVHTINSLMRANVRGDSFRTVSTRGDGGVTVTVTVDLIFLEVSISWEF